MLTQELKNHRRPARARAFAHAQSNSPQWVALSAEVASLQKTVLTLQGEVNALSQELAKIQANNVQALDPFVSVDPNSEVGVSGPNIIFSGANIHILSGSGATDDGGKSLGLGNLIIGYDEDPSSLHRDPLNPGDRGGSHNLVIGRGHRFTQAAFGGFVAGEINTISNPGSSVSGGASNTASGPVSSVGGGRSNTASGPVSSVSGGGGNTASSFQSSVSGGVGNTASGDSSSVLGGRENTASGEISSVLGGRANTAGRGDSIAPQPPFPS